MEIKDAIKLPIFLNVFIKDDIFFNSIKEKFPEIYADLVSSRDNPNCSCANKLRAYLISKIESEKNFFLDILSEENIKNLLKREEERLFKKFSEKLVRKNRPR
jgi:hypothetical protein